VVKTEGLKGCQSLAKTRRGGKAELGLTANFSSLVNSAKKKTEKEVEDYQRARHAVPTREKREFGSTHFHRQRESEGPTNLLRKLGRGNMGVNDDRASHSPREGSSYDSPNTVGFPIQ